jgi:hypothetical protein
MAEYLEGMLGLGLGLVPVVREDIEEILNRLEVTRFEFALPAERLSGKLMEGEWADVLDSASRLMNQGTFRISLSVGRSGRAEDKQRIRDRIQQLIDLFRRAGSVEHFDYVVAEGKDSLTGDREVIDLLKERFISHIEVDPDVFNDPRKSTAEAISILGKQARDNEAFFALTLPEIKGSADSGSVPDIVAGGVAAVRQALAAAIKEERGGGKPTEESEGSAEHELVRG